MAVALLAPGPAWASEEGESNKAIDLVQQAIGYLANDGGAERALEKTKDALDAPDSSGVDLALVRQAAGLLQGDPRAQQLQQARELLTRAAPSLDRPSVGKMATGAETGTTRIFDEFRPARGINGPGDVVLVLIGLLAIGVGLWLSRLWRPHHSIRELRRMSATQTTDSETGERS